MKNPGFGTFNVYQLLSNRQRYRIPWHPLYVYQYTWYWYIYKLTGNFVRWPHSDFIEVRSGIHPDSALIYCQRYARLNISTMAVPTIFLFLEACFCAWFPFLHENYLNGECPCFIRMCWIFFLQPLLEHTRQIHSCQIIDVSIIS